MNKRMMLRVAVVVVACMALAAMQACKRDTPQQDPFIEKWRTVAAQSQGHSPKEDEVPLDVDERNLMLEEGYEDVTKLLEEPSVERPLPTIPVTLEMHKASLVAVIKALSKAANVSVMISPNIGDADNPPTISVVVDRKPWNEVFIGVLKTNGLSYSWEGGILRVKTKGDMEKDIEMTALKAQNNVQKILLKKSEPPVTRVVKLRYMKAVDMGRIIDRIVFNKISKVEDVARNLEDIRSTAVLRIFGDVSQLETQEKEEEKPKNVPGYVHADIETNSLVIQAARPLMKVIYYLIRKMDQPRKQVRFKAYIIETDSDTARDIGVRWGGVFQYQHPGSDTKYMFAPGGTGNVSAYQGAGSGPKSGVQSPYFGPGVSGQGFGLNFPLSLDEAATRGSALNFMMGTIGGNILDFQLLSLAKENKINIVSSPTLHTQDNSIAQIVDGMDVPYIAGRDEAGNIVVSWKEAELVLKILPQILDDNHIKMAIQIKKDEVDFTYTTIEGTPAIRKKWAESILVARNNETVVIGGLTRQRIDDGEDGLPFLKDIPILGWAFKHKMDRNQMNEMLIFITPTILDHWSGDEVQKSMDQIDRELREDGVSMDGLDGNYIQRQ